MSEPISPDQIGEAQFAVHPPEVFDAFNALIARNWDGLAAKVYQEDAAAEIEKRLGVARTVVFEQGYLNIEAAYRSKGWKVFYDRPAYNESYRASFTFTKKT